MRLAPRVAAVVVVSLAVLVSAVGVASAHESVERVYRLAGGDRVATAVAVADHQRSLPCADPCSYGESVVLARADDYADAIAGGPLAAALNAPLLLTGSNELDQRTGEWLVANSVRQVYLLGGEKALSRQLAAELERNGFRVTRVSGLNRYATAAAVADRLAELSGPARVLTLVEGINADPARGWPDALAATPLVVQEGGAVLLTDTASLAEPTRDAIRDLAPSTVRIVGGTGAVSARVEAEVEALVPDVQRMAGSDRYQTAVAVARASIEAGATPSTLFVATGENCPDALAAGPAAAATGSVMLLAPRDRLPASVQEFLADHGAQVRDLIFVGGRSSNPSVDQSAEAEIRRSFGMCDAEGNYSDDERTDRDLSLSALPHAYDRDDDLDPGGEWFGICNAYDEDLDVSGWTMGTQDNSGSEAGDLGDHELVLPEGTLVEPHSLLKVYIGVGTGEDHSIALDLGQEILDDRSGEISISDAEGVPLQALGWVVDFVE